MKCSLGIGLIVTPIVVICGGLIATGGWEGAIAVGIALMLAAMVICGSYLLANS